MHRRVAGAATLAAATFSGLVLLLGLLRRAMTPGPRTPDDVVTLGVLAIGVLVLGWYLATAIAALSCLVARAAGRAWVTGERRVDRWGAPLARRLLLTGGSAAVAAAAAFSPAVAAPPPVDVGPVAALADDLGWGADDDAATPPADATDEPSEPSIQPEPEVDAASSTAPAPSYTVAPGDTLWAIAEHHLPAGSSAVDVAAAWPAWYAENHDVIGPDPDLIHPGQVLVAPDHDPEEHA
jgi:LysM repeat protein